MSNSKRSEETYSSTSTTSSFDVFCSNPKGSTLASDNYASASSTETSANDSLEKPFLFHLDTKNNGLISPSALLSYLDSLGVRNAEEVLEDLGVRDLEENIALKQIDSWVNDQIMQGIEVVRFPAVKAAFLMLYHEKHILGTRLSQTWQDLNVMSLHIQSSEQRAATLAAEVDDQNIMRDRECREMVEAMERKWGELLNNCHQKNENEQETKDNLIQDLDRIISENKNHFTHVENCLKKENETLRKEKENLYSKCEKIEIQNKSLTKEIAERNNLGKQHLLIKNSAELNNFDKSLDLMKKVEEFSQLNKDLKDRNDELEIKKCQKCQMLTSVDLEEEKMGKSELDDEHAKLYFLCKEENEVVRDNQEEVDLTGNIKIKIQKRAQMAFAEQRSNFNESTAEVNSNYDPTKKVSMSMNDSSDANQNILSDIYEPFLNGITSIEDITSSAKKEEPTPELDRVKQEIVKILSQKENVDKENEALAFSQLNEENKRLREKIETFEVIHHLDQNDVASISETPTENGSKNITDIDRSSPDGQELDSEYPSLSTENNGLTNEEVVKLKEKIKLLETEKSNIVTERMLLDKNEQLEESLELMSSEFESLEDYWQNKMDEERKFYEKQLKSNEKQFEELDVKMKDYEDLLMAVEPKENQVSESDRLSTIDEKRSMEEEVNCWEEEISHLKIRIETLEENHQDEMNKLRLELSKRDEYEEASEPVSLGEKRKVLENSWMKVVESRSQSSLENDARQEARRLQELNNYIQLECDQLLQRRDRLQQEVGCQSGYSWGYGQSSTSMDTFLLPNIPQCQPFANQDQCCFRKSVTTGKNLDFPAEDLSSVAHAYTAVLQDITREICLAESELTNPNTITHMLILRSLHQTLDHQVSRCQHLQSSLGLVRAQSSQAIAAMKGQHATDISQLEALVISSQELVRKQTRKHAEQMDKLVSSDSLLDKLCSDNLNIMGQLREIKKNCSLG